MLVVDASCLFEVVVGSTAGEQIRQRLLKDTQHSAPHLVDAEVLAVIRAHRLAGKIDATAANQAVEDLRSWPGDRYGHTLLIPRVWELRHAIRVADGLYVALAEMLDATLLTLDTRLAGAHGPECQIELIGS